MTKNISSSEKKGLTYDLLCQYGKQGIDSTLLKKIGDAYGFPVDTGNCIREALDDLEASLYRTRTYSDEDTNHMTDHMTDEDIDRFNDDLANEYDRNSLSYFETEKIDNVAYSEERKRIVDVMYGILLSMSKLKLYKDQFNATVAWGDMQKTFGIDRDSWACDPDIESIEDIRMDLDEYYLYDFAGASNYKEVLNEIADSIDQYYDWE